MSSEYISRLRREVVAAAAREQAGRRRRRIALPVRRIALAAAAVAALIAALVVLPPRAQSPAPAGGDRLEYVLPARDAEVLRERVSLSGLDDVSVSVAGEQVRLSAPRTLRAAVDALIAPGRFAVYDWERSVIGADGRLVKPDPAVAGDGALPLYRAVVVASERPAQAGGRDAFWLLDDARERVLAGPASSAAGFTVPGRAVRVPAGTAVARAEGASDRAYVLDGTPALTEADLADAQVDRDEAIGRPVVQAQLTQAGAEAFSGLTREVARRGAALKANQHLALVLDGRVLAVPYIDYRHAPNGIDGSEGLQVSGGLTAQGAAILAAILCSGPLPGG